MTPSQTKTYIGTIITVCFSITCVSLGWCFAISNRVTTVENKQQFFKETLDDIKHYQEESTKEIKLISTTLTRLLTKYESAQTRKESN